MVHVDLHTGKKHEVEQPYLSEHLETHVACKDIETVGAHNHAGNDHPDHMRYLYPVEQHGHKQDYSQHYQENQSR